VRIYANGWAGRTTIEDGVERGLRIKAMGFTAAKFDPFPGPWRTHVDRKDEDFAIRYVASMREALGEDFELLIEAHRRFAPAHAIRIGHRLAEFGIEWYEEPCLADNLSLLAEVRDKVSIPIVTGEALYTKESFFECLARRAADILNPDICAIGGISALMDISMMAQPQAVVMSPHNYNSPLVGLAATVHVSAVIPNFKITEYFVNFEERCRAIATKSLDVSEGWIDLPTAPGLGIDIDVAKLRGYPHREASHHGLRHYTEEYPRKGYVPSLRDEHVSP
jgi:galactonate dehydratase